LPERQSIGLKQWQQKAAVQQLDQRGLGGRDAGQERVGRRLLRAPVDEGVHNGERDPERRGFVEDLEGRGDGPGTSGT
jgi:hypothetical protein